MNAVEKVRACRSYRRTLVLRSDGQQTICEIFANVKIRLALGRRAAPACRKCSAPKAYDLLAREWVRTGGRPVERLGTRASVE